MSASTSNSSLVRSRSLRIPTSGNLKPAAPVSSTQTSPGPSYINLFLTNLRLLDLDLRNDWPDITVLTFTTRDAQQNQKKRIQSVEWALFHLFALWDPEETRNKLQPFFPPLEQLQSLNLRAALFRCLDQAKKIGVLGRDIVLRKSMLDECKGERLEEVLAVFSSVVLKRVVQENAESDGSIAKELALENISHTGERTVLSALILAHKGSLTTHLREKNTARARARDFEDLLNLNERRIARRYEQLKEMIGDQHLEEKLSRREVEGIQHIVQGNWTGSDRWLNEILYGNRSTDTGLLGTRFEQVWRNIEDGSIGELEGKVQTGLMEQLDARVKDQENRLAKWQAFGRKLEKGASTSPSKTTLAEYPKPMKLDLGFNKHQVLQVGRSDAPKVVDAAAPTLEEYSRLIENMEAELEEVRKPQRPSKISEQSPALEKRRPHVPAVEKVISSAVSEDFRWSSESKNSGPSLGFASYETKSMSQTSPSEAPLEVSAVNKEPGVELKKPGLPKKVGENSYTLRTREVSLPKQRPRSPPIASGLSEHVSTSENLAAKGEQDLELDRPEVPHGLIRSKKALPQERMNLKQRSVSPLPVLPTTQPHEPPKLTPPIDHEAELADEILNSMAAASPSPKKRHTLSLAERTRLSMSRNSHSQFSDLHDKFEIADLPRLTIKPRHSLAPHTLIEESGSEKHADLIERTRKSMVGFEAAQKKAQIERRKSIKDEKKKQRQSSYFPKLEEEEASPDISAIELMEGDADCASVFKSRPKIATSPSVSPSRIWEDEEQD